MKEQPRVVVTAMIVRRGCAHIGARGSSTFSDMNTVISISNGVSSDGAHWPRYHVRRHRETDEFRRRCKIETLTGLSEDARYDAAATH